MSEIAKPAKDDFTPPGPASPTPSAKDWGLTFLTAFAVSFLAYVLCDLISPGPFDSLASPVKRINNINALFKFIGHMVAFHIDGAVSTADDGFYLVYITVAGFITGALRPKAVSVTFLGSYCGQVLYAVITEKLTLWSMMLPFTYFITSAFFLAAAALAAKIRLFFFNQSKRSQAIDSEA